MDRTDPLLPPGAEPSETAKLLRESSGVRLEHVQVANGRSLSRSFIRLTVPSDTALAVGLQRIMLSAPEQVSGFEDQLLQAGVELAAALTPPDLSLNQLHASMESQALTLLRPCDLLRGVSDICRLLNCARSESGLGWPVPTAEGIGLVRIGPRQPAGYARVQFMFTAWDELSAAAADSPASLVELFACAALEACAAAELRGQLYFASEMRQVALLLRAAAQAVSSYDELAARIEALRCDIQMVGCTDPGRRREHNEDAYLTLQLDQHSAAGAEFMLAAVADGMGGHLSGEIASSLALDLLRQQLALAALPPRTRHQEAADLKQQLLAIIPAIGRVLVERAEMDSSYAGMGTTLCGLARYQPLSTTSAAPAAVEWSLFSVGDSRAYLITAAGLLPLTSDHSYVQELVDSGALAAEAAFDHPNKNVITRCLGGGGQNAIPDIYQLLLGPGDIVLLCSDGLSDALRDNEIWDVINSSALADTAPAALDSLAQSLIAAANEAGGPDNITVLLLACSLKR